MADVPKARERQNARPRRALDDDDRVLSGRGVLTGETPVAPSYALGDEALAIGRREAL
jgi:hypothetical protein